MLILFIIMPIIIAAIVSAILICLVGMTVITSFIAGAGICAVLGILFSWVSHEWDNELYYSIVGWIAAFYLFWVWVIALGIHYYAG